jgi:hypothetical protein
MTYIHSLNRFNRPLGRAEFGVMSCTVGVQKVRLACSNAPRGAFVRAGIVIAVTVPSDGYHCRHGTSGF